MSAATPFNAATWFEIPANDLDALQAFYEQMLDRPLRREQFGVNAIAVFASSEQGGGGCLHSGPGARAPASQGTLVYLDCQPSLDAALQRAAAAGAEVSLPRTALPPGMGFMAHVIDPQGNRVGLHSLS